MTCAMSLLPTCPTCHCCKSLAYYLEKQDRKAVKAASDKRRFGEEKNGKWLRTSENKPYEVKRMMLRSPWAVDVPNRKDYVMFTVERARFNDDGFLEVQGSAVPRTPVVGCVFSVDTSYSVQRLPPLRIEDIEKAGK